MGVCRFCGTEPNKSDPSHCQTREAALVCPWLPQKLRAKAEAEAKSIARALGDVTRRFTFASARRMAGYRNPSVRRQPNWSFAMELFGLGSTCAWAICVEMGVDPDATTATPWDTPSPGVPTLFLEGR